MLHQPQEEDEEAACFFFACQFGRRTDMKIRTTIDHPEIDLLGRDDPLVGPGDIMRLACIQMCHLLCVVQYNTVIA